MMGFVSEPPHAFISSRAVIAMRRIRRDSGYCIIQECYCHYSGVRDTCVTPMRPCDFLRWPSVLTDGILHDFPLIASRKERAELEPTYDL